MIEIIPISEAEHWDSIVKSFRNANVYYLSGYVKAFQLNGDGTPELYYYHSDDSCAICVMMKRDISKDTALHNKLPSNTLFDIITPYGYGGFVFDEIYNADSTNKLMEELLSLFQSKNYVSAFFRFNPVSKNAHLHDSAVNVIDLGKTIALDLSSPEVIWQNITSKNRNMIRKAEKSGVKIKHGKGMELLSTFKEIYDETMRNDNAEKYYFFPIEFYESIDSDLNNNYEIFYAEYEGKIIAMSIMLFAGSQMDYHLSGSRYEYRNLAPSNLLLYKAALWGAEQGFKTFHLGGGVGSGEDNLYKFKAAFNRNSDYQFSIGKMIIDEQKYNELIGLRHLPLETIENVKYFPIYRLAIESE